MDIHHGLNGSRRVEVTRADHSRIVAERGHGYVEHPYRYGGREFGHRTYYYHGRVYDRYYGHYYYHGAYLGYYAPAFYYRPAFYGWAYNPWAAPVSFAWGWAGNPWYAYYGAYFTPYPVYANASLWLTDYMISTTLAAAYQAQVDANAAAQAQVAAANAVAMTEATKNLVAAEVQRQIALENAESQSAQTAAPDPASSSIQRLLTDGVQHVFLVGASLDVVNGQGAECAVSEGDALQLTGPPAPDATAADLVMLSTKGGLECQQGATVSVSFTDLQDMQNHMRESIDQGMGELQAKQGKGGLPAEPSAAAGAPVKSAMASTAPPPDQNVASEISDQTKAADQAETETVAQVNQAGGTAPESGDPAPQPIAAPAPPPAQISMGQSIDDVTAALGNPKNIVDLGTKKIYVYNDMKITFKNGKVADVQ